MINNICSICGGGVIHVVLTSIPPINQFTCQKCGAVRSEREEIQDVVIDMGTL